MCNPLWGSSNHKLRLVLPVLAETEAQNVHETAASSKSNSLSFSIVPPKEKEKEKETKKIWKHDELSKRRLSELRTSRDGSV